MLKGQEDLHEKGVNHGAIISRQRDNTATAFFSESELLEGLMPDTAHADEVTILMINELEQSTQDGY